MREMLAQANLALLGEIDLLIAALPSREKIIHELAAYYDQIFESCHELRRKVVSSLADLKLGNEDIFIDILSNTQTYTREFHLFNYRLVSPVQRYRSSDLLCLKIINWLHRAHDQTQKMPGAFCDGNIGIYPSLGYPITYFMPASAQYGLLYLPLFFHEFGHLLYACHRPELDELVIELQNDIKLLLESVAKQSSDKTKKDAHKRTIIMQTWFTWTQELFCDAVGFQIGGLSYVNAFSMYLKMWGSDRFYLSFEKLAYSSHPVAWLRIKLLCEHLRRADFEHEANQLKKEWHMIADMLSLSEDYFGFYNDDFLEPISKTIADMLTETEPYRFRSDEITEMEIDGNEISPIRLLNTGWLKFYEDPQAYQQWEKEAIARFVDFFENSKRK